MPKLSGKTAIVTGAARGIGRAVAERLAQDGAAVVVNGVSSRETAEAVAHGIREAGGRAHVAMADVSQPEEVRRLFDEAERVFGPLDIVAAMAGVLKPVSIARATPEDYDWHFSINVKGTFLTFSEAARRMRDGGRIIGCSSNLTRMPREGLGLYQASKAAVELLTKSLAKEVGRRQITVNTVAPGGTDTDMLTEERRQAVASYTPLGRVGMPRDIADVVAFLASDDARWVNGQVIGVNGGVI